MQPEDVKGILLLKGLSYDEVETFLTFVSDRTIEAGTDIVTIDETDNDFFLILSGSVQVIKLTRTGEEKIYANLGRGDIFGEIALFLSSKRTATVRAEQPTELLVLTKEKELELEAAHPALATKLIRNILAIEIKRFIVVADQADNASFWI